MNAASLTHEKITLADLTQFLNNLKTLGRKSKSFRYS